MNRRVFFKNSLSATLFCAYYNVTFLTGCNKQQQLTLAQEANVIGTTAAAIATQLGDASLAKALTDATNTAVNLITNWKQGSPTAQIEQALTALLSVINQIPVLNSYATLISILIAGVEAALALLPQSSTPAVITPMARKLMVNDYFNNQIMTFREQYNQEIVKHPELNLHVI